MSASKSQENTDSPKVREERRRSRVVYTTTCPYTLAGLVGTFAVLVVVVVDSSLVWVIVVRH